MAKVATDEEGAGLAVSIREGGLVVEGPQVAQAGGSQWLATALDERRILLVTDEAKLSADTASGLAACDVALFKEFLLSLHASSWSGLLVADTGHGVKRLYFSHGQIVFAGSNLLDDRLGEVMYRDGKLTLAELTSAAAQVTKARKFGQVLISSGVASNLQIWQAFQGQIRQIVRSLFMVDRVYYEMQAGSDLAPIEVDLSGAVADFVNEAYSYGVAFREFLGKLRQESEVHLLVDRDSLASEYPAGSFVGEQLEMIVAHSGLQSLLDAGKLIDVYTVATLFQLVSQGLCALTPDDGETRRSLPDMAPLKAKIDAHAYVLQLVLKAFDDAGVEFPANDCRTFAAKLNSDGFPAIVLGAQAELSRACVSGIFSQCAASSGRIDYFAVRIESLIQFLLQVAGDNLDFKAAGKIRQAYRAVAV